MHFWTATLALVAMFAVSLEARAATVTATLDPQQISVGDSAQLTVSVSGGSGQPSLPAIDGLDIQAVGQSTQIEIVNGSMTSNATITYQVTPQREGTFTIPAIQAGGASSQPITLRVGKGSANGLAGPAQNNLPPPATGPVVMPNGAAAQPDANAPQVSGDRFGSIQISLTKKEFYVGELVPVDIKVFIAGDANATVTDLPQFTSDGFTLNSLGTKPEQTEQVANGRAYTVLTWHSALTAVKTGDFSAALKMPLSVVVQQQMPQGDADDTINNFFRNAMAAMGQRRQVDIKSDDLTLKVLPLPQENRPADFSGAVGQFDIEASANPTAVNAGDPVTLRLKITGSGNFDRVSTTMLPADAHWKTYSPKSTFQPSDSVGFSGAKTFEQPIIPSDSSVASVPSISFSFFNPETRQYVTRTTAPVAVTVSGSAPAAPAPIAASTPAPSNQPVPPASDLRPNKLESGSFVSTLRPVYLSPWFIAGQGVPILALLGALAFIRRQKHVTHPERLRANAVQQAIRAQIDAMDEAMKNHQTGAFFIHARSAFQQQLGHEWKMTPDAITLADVETRLVNGLETVRPVFEMADQAKYSDLHFGDADLQQWRDAIVNQLAEKI